jgi:hypothetical protein
MADDERDSQEERVRLIGSGGLLLVVFPSLFAIPILVLWVGLKKK